METKIRTHYTFEQIKQAGEALGFASPAALALDLNVGYTTLTRYGNGYPIREAERLRIEHAVKEGLCKASRNAPAKAANPSL